jgi:hypothetical protein
MDIDGIQPGEDFVKELESAVASSHVLIALIGRNWLDIRGHDGKRRLDDPADFVRLEVATALRRNILVIPALVQDARMPGESDLPDALRPLARRQAIEISDTRFNQDVERLIEVIRASGAIPAPAAVTSTAKADATGRRRVARRSWTAAALVILAALLVWGVPVAKRRFGGSDPPVTAPPVVRRLAAEPTRYIQGQVDNVKLTWDVEGATEVSLTGLGSIDAKGSRTVNAPTQDTAYELHARNRLGESNARATVDVMSLDEFINVDAPSPETQATVKKWLAEYLRSLQEIGYLPELRGVQIATQPDLDNAYFDGRTRRIVIGQRLVGDRDVVLREYSHLMLTSTHQGGSDPLSTADASAIESGLADYLPASAVGDPRIGEVAGPILLKRPYIRILINNGKFDEIRPEDPPQVAGETWGGAFWEMRLALGRAQVDPYLITAWSDEMGSGAIVGRRFVSRILERASATDPKLGEQIRRVLEDRHFPF